MGGNIIDNSAGTAVGATGLLQPSKLNDLIDSSVAATLVVAVGSTSTVVRTDATQADNFHDGLTLVVINTTGTVSRNIQSYSNTNGAFTLDMALPFTPATSDRAMVVNSNELTQLIFANSALIPALL